MQILVVASACNCPHESMFWGARLPVPTERCCAHAAVSRAFHLDARHAAGRPGVMSIPCCEACWSCGADGVHTHLPQVRRGASSEARWTGSL